MFLQLGGASLPSGAIGIWYADQYQSGTRPYIRNSASANAISPNLFVAPRRLFGTITAGATNPFWSTTNLTVTDSNATAQDASGDATTITNAGGGTGFWRLSPSASGVTWPAGTYTLAIWAKWNGSGGTDVKLGRYNIEFATVTLTSSWQRVVYTFTLGSPTSVNLMLAPSGLSGNTTAYNLSICDFDLFQGASDLGSDTLSGHLYFGTNALDSAAFPSYSSGILDCSNGGYGTIQFPSAQTLTQMTAIAVMQHANSGTNISHQAWLSSAVNYNTWAVGSSIAGSAGFFSGSTPTGVQFPLFDTVGDGLSVLTHRYDGVTQDSFNSDFRFQTAPVSLPSQSIADFLFNTIRGDYYSGHKYSAVVLYNRALTNAEIVMAARALTARVTANGNSLQAEKYVMFEGHSIAFGSSADANLGYNCLVANNASPRIRGTIVAEGGSIIFSLQQRMASNIAYFSNRKEGRKIAISIDIGANDLDESGSYYNNPTGFVTDLFAIYDAYRAAGIPVIAHTVLPRTSDADGGTQFNSNKTTANALIRAGSAHYDALSDEGGDAIMGLNSQPNSATYYVPKTHPNNAGHALIEPYVTAAVNSL